MNKSLTTLMSKLNEQLNELNLNVHTVLRKKQEFEQQIQQIEERINQTTPGSLTINPTIEINRLNFITQQQEKKEALILDLKNYQDIENKLKEKIKRVKIELNMLMHYLEREETNQKKRFLDFTLT
ncbi:hypothetical protein LEAN103870_14145 [Legionella anisa]|uniref:Uncharacterized protein n=1 Tax=Legionella anisa TaxID=28082 RepID=A0AAX0WTI9_9GAMM|nr:hypothetical protein [Legionella anisa]AWN74605.1 hypothetical protein DLD14_12570 [Legionella anisa]KTC76212.1 hypothetical protein Lani_0501 [Legionella anisa]MBN5937237.1 hypothetical protein [Legionella anisa]MCW8425279.1 hypothetical protein [Legionella anisa]MCW8449292.1 hypothetical protein [Legionella anisa]